MTAAKQTLQLIADNRALRDKVQTLEAALAEARTLLEEKRAAIYKQSVDNTYLRQRVEELLARGRDA